MFRLFEFSSRIGLSAGIAQVSQSDSLMAFSRTRKSRRVPRLRWSRLRGVVAMDRCGLGLAVIHIFGRLCLLFG